MCLCHCLSVCLIIVVRVYGVYASVRPSVISFLNVLMCLCQCSSIGIIISVCRSVYVSFRPSVLSFIFVCLCLCFSVRPCGFSFLCVLVRLCKNSTVFHMIYVGVYVCILVFVRLSYHFSL